MRKKRSLGYVSLEVVIICAVVLTAGIGGIAAFTKNGQSNHTTMVEKEEEVYYAAWNGNPGETGGNIGGGGSSSNRPGLYDENDVLLYSWDVLVNDYGFNVEKDYEWEDSDRPANILNDNNDLKDGVKLIIPEGVSKIGKNAFAYVPNLEYVIFPESIISFGDYAFSECEKLKTYVPSSVLNFGRVPFEYTHTLCYNGPTLDENGEKRFGAGQAHFDGDGDGTCDLCNSYLLTGTAYAIYSETDNSLRFFRSETPVKVGDNHNGLTVTEVYTGFEETAYEIMYREFTTTPWNNKSYSIKSVIVEDMIKPIDTTGWFFNFTNCSTFNLKLLNTSDVKSMSFMFFYAGSFVDYFSIGGIQDWNVSNVEDMSGMFYGTGGNYGLYMDLSDWNVVSVKNMASMFQNSGGSSSWYIGDLSKWNVSSVENMNLMFSQAGASSYEWNIGDIGKWNVSSVKSMYQMFRGAGSSVDGDFVLGDFSNWNMSNANDISYMFQEVGYFTTGKVSIKGLDKWDTSSVENMAGVFNRFAYKSNKMPDIGNISNWNTSNVKYMGSMFSDMGYSFNGDFVLGDFSNWDTSNVTNMVAMFDCTGYNAKTFKITGIDRWNTSNVTDMQHMFRDSGYNSSAWNVGAINNWNTENVTNMNAMFEKAGYRASYSLNLKNWVHKVTTTNGRLNFNKGVESKVLAPTW